MTNEDDSPWPLMAVSIINKLEAERVNDPEALLEALMQQLYITTRNKLREAGRLRDVRRLTLVCHNEDENVVQIVKNQPTGEEE